MHLRKIILVAVFTGADGKLERTEGRGKETGNI